MAKAAKQTSIPQHTVTDPVISADYTQCTVKDLVLRVNHTIDFKFTNDPKVSIGKIIEFKYAGWRQCDKSSVWMNVVAIEKAEKTEWLSVNVWAEQEAAGLFTAKQKENESNKPQVTGKRPF